MQNIKRSFLVANVFLACNNKSGTAANCGVAVMMVFHTKFNQNWIIYEDFKILGRGERDLHMQLFLILC